MLSNYPGLLSAQPSFINNFYPNLSGLDKALVALKKDYKDLRMLFQSSDSQFERVVTATGLRIVIREELT